ncbi:MAG: hypothetical protein HOC05_10890, partial [Gemmatimonadetes bacterium]|nr:hypothetical protein [Gemmatimonadota bacterium]
MIQRVLPPDDDELLDFPPSIERLPEQVSAKDLEDAEIASQVANPPVSASVAASQTSVAASQTSVAASQTSVAAS